ncbi:MAG: Na+/H+ antiporter NhaA [Kiloniellales bacterium]|nr:Na+/H+ antiporter NhaA [Kiloniellales bacterium]
MDTIRKLLSGEAAGGVLLIGATLAALVFSNTSLNGLYSALLDTMISVNVSEFGIEKPLLLWINDGLMAVFFLLVGLELKREVLEGELSDPQRATLPLVAALGGIAIPALIYAGLNYEDPAALQGWAIPAATDIAFALGILALLGSRVPVALKVFLLAVAIIDDLAAIIIIALFYTDNLSTTSLAISALGIVALVALNRSGVLRLAPYILVGAFVWVFLLKSGVHATLAGVVTALFVPHARPSGSKETVLLAAEHGLKPWVMLGIMPLFAFANAGVNLVSLPPSSLFGPVSLGIALGLFIGKQVGILGFVWIAVRSGLANLPRGVSWQQLHGAALLAGIGFTMSLFIGTLAFEDPEYAAAVRVGVLSGSILSGLAGFLILRRSLAGAGERNAGRARAEVADATAT